MEAAENCSVKVAVLVRPLIGDERAQGCKECVSVTPGKPQVSIGSHSFTFDHVYGNGGSPSSALFEDCIALLVDGLFQGYNGTVLAYGQTGSGKTYTMGTALKDGCQTGVIPQVMSTLFKKIDNLKHETEFRLHVSFIEIFKEEVRDLLDSMPVSKSVVAPGHVGKVTVPGKCSIQIRESSNGAITLSGSTEVAVGSLQEMATCLEHGSISRATGSTNMNNQSSRSHAIFTIMLEQMRKVQLLAAANQSPDMDVGEEYLCAKLHLVDLAGSERAKRTGSDGLRLKEGIYINRGLLALGNVISALGDEKKRKEGVHVPYRDSKLTRLLQDSLGGNSRTVMVACISPADINAEESLNTLKYANRARNIQNKPVVNRDLISCEMQKMRQQLQYLQSELCARGGGAISGELQVLKEKIVWLEATNEDLRRQLHDFHSRRAVVQHCETDDEEGDNCSMGNGLERGFQSMDSSDYQISETISGDNNGELDEVAREWEHAVRQNTMGRELNELNKCLEQKKSEMKLVGGYDTESLKQQFGRKIMELEEEKRIAQQERDRLLAEVENLAANSDGQTQKLRETSTQKLRGLEAQILNLKRKQENHIELIKQKQKSDEAARRLQAEIQYIKSQKVQLHHKMKQEAEQFRQWKAYREKELLQLRKEGRRNEYERHKLEALNQRQKMVLQRKTEEAAMATKRLRELLEARKSSAHDNSVNSNWHMVASGQSNEKSLQSWLDQEMQVVVNVHEVRFEYKKQSHLQAALSEELMLLKQIDELSFIGEIPQGVKNGHARLLSMSTNARMERITSLENMLSMSSNALKEMASQLSEAERERALVGRGRWNHVRSLVEAKNLLQHMFDVTADARCQLWEKSMMIKDIKDQLNQVTALLRQSEAQKKELVKEQLLREQTVAIALAAAALGNSRSSSKHGVDELSGPLSPVSVPAPKQLKLSPGIVNVSLGEPAAFLDQTRKMVPVGQLSMKKLATVGHSGKLWRWKRSHHQWLLQFKWKWQKPWKLSEWIKHSDETIMRSRPRIQALI